MPMPNVVAGVVSVAIMALGAGVVCGQDYPKQAIRIVTTGVGGGTDFLTRLIAQGISGPLGQQVIVDNRSSGVIPGEIVSKAPPDGYTLLMIGNAIWTAPLLQKTPYDISDLAPVTLAARAPCLLLVNPSLPVKSVKELVALAKARPGEINYSTGGLGSTTHISGELFKSLGGVNIVRITYKADTAQIADLVTGQVQMAFGSPGQFGALMKSGKLRALAVTSAQPSALFPELPTLAASLPGFDVSTIYGVFAPAKTPLPIISRLHQEMARFLGRPETKDKFLSIETEPVGMSPGEFGAVIKAEVARLSKVIKDAGVRVE